MGLGNRPGEPAREARREERDADDFDRAEERPDTPWEEVAAGGEEGAPAPAEAGPAAAREAGDERPLPPLDDLVRRIPEATRAALDELFRARFSAVRRLPQTSK